MTTYTLTYFDPYNRSYEKITELNNEQAHILVNEFRAMGFDAEVDADNR